MFDKFGEQYIKHDNYTYLNLRIGRDLNISKHLGIDIDAGILFEISHERNYTTWLDIDMPVLPSAGFRIFYRI